MFTNSLFSDFLTEQGLKIHKGESTRDIVCLEFNFGSKSYKKELRCLYKMSDTARYEYYIAKIHGDKYLTDKVCKKRKQISELLRHACKNKSKYKSLTKEQLRTLFYNEGVSIEYKSYDKNGNIKKSEVMKLSIILDTFSSNRFQAAMLKLS